MGKGGHCSSPPTAKVRMRTGRRPNLWCVRFSDASAIHRKIGSGEHLICSGSFASGITCAVFVTATPLGGKDKNSCRHRGTSPFSGESGRGCGVKHYGMPPWAGRLVVSTMVF